MGKIDVKNMDLYYGQFHALKNINLEIPGKENYRFHWTKWLWKIHFVKVLKPYE